MDNDPQTVIAMRLIIAGGNSKSASVEALRAAKKGDFAMAIAKLKEADMFLSKAHNDQTEQLMQEANGKEKPITLLMIHSQDHVMNAITFRDVAGEIINLYKKLYESKK